MQGKQPPRNTTITKVETASLLQGIWPVVTCAVCQKDLGAKDGQALSIFQAECWLADISTAFQGGKVYVGVQANACSDEHARQFLDTEKWPPRAELSGDIAPSQSTTHRTIYAARQKDDYPQDTRQSGKWLLFPANSDVDGVWKRIKNATEQGQLGGYSKVVYNPRKPTSLICVYTSDYGDRRDVFRIRQALRELGFTQKLAYKADETTMRGIYRQPGQRVSLYYE